MTAGTPVAEVRGESPGGAPRKVEGRVPLAHRVEYVAARAMIALLQRVPRRLALAIGRGLGITVMRLGIRRRLVRAQIGAAFPERSEPELQRLTRDTFAHFGRVLAEAALLPTLGPAGIRDMVEASDGFEAIEAARDAGRGLILITGHFGNWELSAAYVAARGVPIEPIARHMSNRLFDAYVYESRKASGLAVLFDDQAARRAPRAFREGHAVAFVSDQGVKGLASTFVPFFGRPAKTPRGAAVFALRLGLPTFFVTTVLQPSGKYRFVVHPLELVDTGQRDADVDALVSRFSLILEQHVREYPWQYFWLHHRWKRQPPNTPPELQDPLLASGRDGR